MLNLQQFTSCWGQPNAPTDTELCPIICGSICAKVDVQVLLLL
jgi:hypothetical protein